MDYFYCPRAQADFYKGPDSIGETFIPQKDDSHVSFLCDTDEVVVSDEIFNKINDDGNLVFIHPDSI